MSKLVKRLENGTDFDVCVFLLKSGKYAVTVYDNVDRTHEKQDVFDDLADALVLAKKLNKNYRIDESKTNKGMKKNVVKINENTLRKIVAESVKKVLDFASNKPQYDINSPEYGEEWRKGLDFDDTDETEKEIEDYEALPDKARHPYGSEFPDFSERIANRRMRMSKYGDKLAQKEPNSVLNTQNEKKASETMVDRAKKSLGFAIWCAKGHIKRTELSDDELSHLCSIYLDELERRREEDYWD